MSFPNIPNVTPLISVTVRQTVPLLLASIALEELSLAHIMNAEAEKLQFSLGTLTGTGVALSPAIISLSNLFDLDTSVQRTLRDVIKKEMLLEFKFENIFDVIASLPPTFPPQTFTFTTPEFKTLIVPVGATRARILAVGAAGGNSGFSSATGGKGASIQGDFSVTSGESLAIVVGGTSASTNFGAGGGGGSFVWRGTTFSELNSVSILVAAGGGGGSGFTLNGVDASILSNGTDSNPPNPPFGIGGTGGTGGGGGNGSAGSSDSTFESGGGGAGVFLNGGNGGPLGTPFDGGGGMAINSNANGGSADFFGNGTPGGFGGGGGGGADGGGGGGYSGGGGGSNEPSFSGPFGGGGGGGSLNNGTNQVNTAGVGTDNGSVIITFF